VETAAVTDEEDAPERLRRSTYLGYAAGDVGNNLAFSMSSMFLLIYYTDVVGISAAAVGTMLLIVRAFDAFADLFAGRVVDSTSTRWGKFRPFLLFGSLPLLLLNVAIFTVPDFGGSGKLAYAYISYAIFGLAYSLVNIPYGSLATAMTQDPSERAKLASLRVVGANLAILLLAAVVSPQIHGSSDLQRSLTITTLALVVLGMPLYLFSFFSTREQVQREEDRVSFRETTRTLRANKALIRLCLSALMFLTGWFSLQTVAVFYARDVLGNVDLYIVLTVVQTVGVFLAAALVPRLAGAIGKKPAYQLFGMIAIGSGIGAALAPASTPEIAITFFGVLGVGLGGVNTLMFALAADTVDYGEWKTGHRTEGASYSVFSFTRKMGQGIGAALAAYTIGLGGYVEGAATQPRSAVHAIKAAAGLVPAGFIVIAVLIMTTYPLTDDVFRRIVREVAERRFARVVSTARLADSSDGPRGLRS
jgi:glucuronide carrier protein